MGSVTYSSPFFNTMLTSTQRKNICEPPAFRAYIPESGKENSDNNNKTAESAPLFSNGFVFEKGFGVGTWDFCASIGQGFKSTTCFLTKVFATIFVPIWWPIVKLSECFPDASYEGVLKTGRDFYSIDRFGLNSKHSSYSQGKLWESVTNMRTQGCDHKRMEEIVGQLPDPVERSLWNKTIGVERENINDRVTHLYRQATLTAQNLDDLEDGVVAQKHARRFCDELEVALLEINDEIHYLFKVGDNGEIYRANLNSQCRDALVNILDSIRNKYNLDYPSVFIKKREENTTISGKDQGGSIQTASIVVGEMTIKDMPQAQAVDMQNNQVTSNMPIEEGEVSLDVQCVVAENQYIMTTETVGSTMEVTEPVLSSVAAGHSADKSADIGRDYERKTFSYTAGEVIGVVVVITIAVIGIYTSVKNAEGQHNNSGPHRHHNPESSFSWRHHRPHGHNYSTTRLAARIIVNSLDIVANGLAKPEWRYRPRPSIGISSSSSNGSATGVVHVFVCRADKISLIKCSTPAEARVYREARYKQLRSTNNSETIESGL